MFEVIGYIAVSLVVTIFLLLQYIVILPHKSFNRDNFIELVIGIIPLLPFIIMFSLLFYYLMEMLYKRFVKWFELNWGWFFVNGRKRNAWSEYLRKKYDE